MYVTGDIEAEETSNEETEGHLFRKGNPLKAYKEVGTLLESRSGVCWCMPESCLNINLFLETKNADKGVDDQTVNHKSHSPALFYSKKWHASAQLPRWLSVQTELLRFVHIIRSKTQITYPNLTPYKWKLCQLRILGHWHCYRVQGALSCNLNRVCLLVIRRVLYQISSLFRLSTMIAFWGTISGIILQPT